MGTALATRDDIRGAELRRLARRESDGRIASRLLAIANGLDRASWEAAARAAGMDRQTLRDWVHRFNAEGLAGLRDQLRPGRPPRRDEGRQAVLKAMILRGPDRERDGVSSWRIVDICRLCEERFGVPYQEAGMLRLVKSLALSWQKSRPAHLQADPAEQKAFKKGRIADGWLNRDIDALMPWSHQGQS